MAQERPYTEEQYQQMKALMGDTLGSFLSPIERASSEPPLQNLPAPKTKLGNKVRKTFFLQGEQRFHGEGRGGDVQNLPKFNIQDTMTGRTLVNKPTPANDPKQEYNLNAITEEVNDDYRNQTGD
jgi:hypothetical protein